MNIDELKNTWNDDVFEETPEISIENKNKISLPLERMRKNMRKEFFSTIGIFIFGFAIVWLCGAPFKFKFYLTILLASMAIVTFFFFSKFFKLYKDMSNPQMKTYDGLKDLLHQFELNKQYYLSFYLSFIPFLVCEIIIVLEFIPRPQPLSDLKIAGILISSVLFGLFSLYLLGKYWFQKFYGKYIVTIENLVIEFQG
ncbi:hypothetical protein ACNFU2_06035 [Chryseobacterium sp. PTM-20240506]|uniref:hypothetical protein n=1 Tax=Chryseobacterium sp. PTM-20240506 TaxID=3400631 RepID=UPI003AB03351